MSSPQTALEALASRRLLVSRWPWRSVGFLFSTLPLAGVAFAVLAIPWLVLVDRIGGDDRRLGPIVLLILLGTALVGALGPVIAVPLANVERRRLRLVDNRAVGLRRRKSGLYTDPATWREVGYTCLMATAAPVLSIAALLAVLLAVTFVASPFLVLAQQPDGGPVALGFGQATTVPQTIPYAIVGVLLLPALGYLLTLVAGAHAAVARALLVGGAAERLRAELVEVAHSRARLVDAFEVERRRIERDLHDVAQQKLVSLTMQLGLARIDLPPDSPAAASLTAAHEQAKQLMGDLRGLIHGIQPQILTDLGLAAALDELADHAPIPVTVQTRLHDRQHEGTAYFAAAEALTNVAKHSGATRATVTAHQQGALLTIEISDNGRGGADPGRGTGLTGLADRVAVTGGRMLLSSPPGGPTLLRVELPCTA
ncbi:histidine kinase [Asanoa ferruginea]|nr:histidine kinase [Asanoa ferruginea]